jgi:hypothetical protein
MRRTSQESALHVHCNWKIENSTGDFHKNSQRQLIALTWYTEFGPSLGIRSLRSSTVRSHIDIIKFHYSFPLSHIDIIQLELFYSELVCKYYNKKSVLIKLKLDFPISDGKGVCASFCFKSAAPRTIIYRLHPSPWSSLRCASWIRGRWQYLTLSCLHGKMPLCLPLDSWTWSMLFYRVNQSTSQSCYISQSYCKGTAFRVWVGTQKPFYSGCLVENPPYSPCNKV